VSVLKGSNKKRMGGFFGVLLGGGVGGGGGGVFWGFVVGGFGCGCFWWWGVGVGGGGGGRLGGGGGGRVGVCFFEFFWGGCWGWLGLGGGGGLTQKSGKRKRGGGVRSESAGKVEEPELEKARPKIKSETHPRIFLRVKKEKN